MIIFKKTFCLLLCFISTLIFAKPLVFTVTNNSKSTVFFRSTDFFDFGKAVDYNQSKSIRYNYPPKNMKLDLGNGAYSNYYIMFDPSCDQIGAPPYRQLTQGHAGTHFKVIRYTQGNMHIIFEDMEGSTVMEKKIKCIFEKS